MSDAFFVSRAFFCIFKKTFSNTNFIHLSHQEETEHSFCFKLMRNQLTVLTSVKFEVRSSVLSTCKKHKDSDKILHLSVNKTVTLHL